MGRISRMVKTRAFVPLQRVAFVLVPLCGVLGYLVSADAEPARQFPTSAGVAIYQERCASCHGVNGKGDGPVAAALTVSPPDLTTIARRAGGAFPAGRVAQVITYGGNMPAHGSQTMPVWGKIFSVEAGRGDRGAQHSRRAVVQLVRYLANIQQD
jgi:mono/diheme cytochrome c family protein